MELAAEYSPEEEGADVWMELAAEYAAEKKVAMKSVLKNAPAVRSSVVNSFVPCVSHDCPNPTARKVLNVARPTQLPTITYIHEPSPHRSEQVNFVKERPSTAPSRKCSEIREDISNTRPKEVQDRLDLFRTKLNCKKAEEQPKESPLAKKPVIALAQIRKHAALCPSRRRWKDIRDEISGTTPKEIQDHKDRRLHLEQQCTCKAKEPVITRERILEHTALCPSRLRWKNIRDEIFRKTPQSIQDKLERVRIESKCNCKMAKEPLITLAQILEHRPLCPSRRLLRDFRNEISDKTPNSIQDKLERVRIESKCNCKRAKEPLIRPAQEPNTIAPHHSCRQWSGIGDEITNTTPDEILDRLRFERECKEAEKQLGMDYKQASTDVVEQPVIPPAQIFEQIAAEDEVLSTTLEEISTRLCFERECQEAERQLIEDYEQDSRMIAEEPVIASTRRFEATAIQDEVLSTTLEEITDRLGFECECVEAEKQLMEDYERMSAVPIEQLVTNPAQTHEETTIQDEALSTTPEEITNKEEQQLIACSERMSVICLEQLDIIPAQTYEDSAGAIPCAMQDEALSTIPEELIDKAERQLIESYEHTSVIPLEQLDTIPAQIYENSAGAIPGAIQHEALSTIPEEMVDKDERQLIESYEQMSVIRLEQLDIIPAKILEDSAGAMQHEALSNIPEEIIDKAERQLIESYERMSIIRLEQPNMIPAQTCEDSSGAMQHEALSTIPEETIDKDERQLIESYEKFSVIRLEQLDMITAQLYEDSAGAMQHEALSTIPEEIIDIAERQLIESYEQMSVIRLEQLSMIPAQTYEDSTGKIQNKALSTIPEEIIDKDERQLIESYAKFSVIRLEQLDMITAQLYEDSAGAMQHEALSTIPEEIIDIAERQLIESYEQMSVIRLEQLSMIPAQTYEDSTGKIQNKALSTIPEEIIDKDERQLIESYAKFSVIRLEQLDMITAQLYEDSAGAMQHEALSTIPEEIIDIAERQLIESYEQMSVIRLEQLSMIPAQTYDDSTGTIQHKALSTIPEETIDKAERQLIENYEQMSSILVEQLLITPAHPFEGTAVHNEAHATTRKEMNDEEEQQLIESEHMSVILIEQLLVTPGQIFEDTTNAIKHEALSIIPGETTDEADRQLIGSYEQMSKIFVEWIPKYRWHGLCAKSMGKEGERDFAHSCQGNPGHVRLGTDRKQVHLQEEQKSQSLHQSTDCR